jgi:hypothetical protein
MNREQKEQIIAALKKRDGFRCQFPGCAKPFTEADRPTIDHWYPKSISGDESLDNLKLMHFACNNIKGDTIPNSDGTLTILRRVKIPKRTRPKLCETCISGRILLDGEICPDCGSEPQPRRFPTAYKRKPKNCSHSGREHCWACVCGFVERKDTVEQLG